MKTPLLSLLLLCSVVISCKSSKKLYAEGQYDRAVYAALDDLRKKPENQEAASILPQAYNEAVIRYENSIAAASLGTQSVQKVDNIYLSYLAMQKMYNAIASTPAAFSHVTAKNYSVELNHAAEQAAEFRYTRGMDLLHRGDRISAQSAYENFAGAEYYVQNYKDVEDRKAEAYELAVVNIVVDKFDERFGMYNINGNFFQNDIVYKLNNIGRSHYYKFYGTNEPRSREVRVDQYLDINIYDLWIGQLFANNYSYEVSKDITEKSDKAPYESKTFTISATVNVTRRIIDSRAMMDYHITDAATRRMVAIDHIPAQYTWEKLTGNYSGDSRALSDKDWAVIRGAFNNQPSHDDLYRELTAQLMNQFGTRMRSIYGR